MSISVIVPTFNASAELRMCIAGLLSAAGEDDEVIVVDDGSTDDPSFVLGRLDDQRVRLVRSETNIGRGPARNLGARHATGSILVFVDADVVVRPDALDEIRRAFTDEGVHALFGSYDDAPSDPAFVSQFRNLLHHHVHHHAGSRASHFWTGLGAVSAEAFHAVGGFDEERWARNMEDVELGHRLNDAGYLVHVRPGVQGTHLKRYTIISMVRSDLFERAIPWVHLTLTDHRTDRFVLSWRQRLAGLGALLIVIGLVMAPFDRAGWGLIALGVVSGGVADHAPLRTMARLRGGWFALRAAPLLFVHSMTAVTGLALGTLSYRRGNPAHEVSRQRPVAEASLDVHRTADD